MASASTEEMNDRTAPHAGVSLITLQQSSYLSVQLMFSYDDYFMLIKQYYVVFTETGKGKMSLERTLQLCELTVSGPWGM